MDTDDLCHQCQDPLYIAVLFFAQFAFLVIFMLMLLFASDKLVNQMEFILLNLRYVFAGLCYSHSIVDINVYSVMWIVGASTSSELPEAVQTMFSGMRVFVGDVSFIHPACSGFTTQASVFGLNVGVAFAITFSAW